MTRFTILAGLLGLVCVFGAPLSVAQDDIPASFSREYKLMLTPSLFVYQNEAQTVARLLAEVENTLESAIGRKVRAKPVLKKQREVRFYDVPRRCDLRHYGYVLRERSDKAQTEVTLKYRATDSQQVERHATQPRAPNAQNKLEADIGVQPDEPFNVVYSHSLSIEKRPALDEWQAIELLFPDFAIPHLNADKPPLALVGGLVIHERVYKNIKIDLGRQDAQMSLTLWYQGQPSANQSPLIAELSFKLDAQAQGYAPKVIERAQQAFLALQSWSAVAVGAATKTARVYQFQTDFCQSSDEQQLAGLLNSETNQGLGIIDSMEPKHNESAY